MVHNWFQVQIVDMILGNITTKYDYCPGTYSVGTYSNIVEMIARAPVLSSMDFQNGHW